MSEQVMTGAAEQKLRHLLAQIGPHPSPRNVELVARAMYFFGKFDGIIASTENLAAAVASVGPADHAVYGSGKNKA